MSPTSIELAAAWKRSGAPGAAIAVFDDASPTIHCFGTDGPTGGSAIDERRVFDAASLSKPVVARWILGLAERGELDLDATMRLDPHVVGAEPDPRLARLTPAMVLSHTPGFPNWRADGQPLRLLATPGERVSYSGEGFEYLLTWARQTRGVATVDSELATTLADAGMTDSSFVDRGPADRSPVVNGHTVANEVIAPPYRPRVVASYSLHTSIRDYARFVVSCIWAGPAGVREPMTRVWARDGRSARTLGWGFAEADGRPVIWQHGDNPGFKHLVAVRPDVGDGWIVLTNGDAGATMVAEFAAAMGIHGLRS